MFSRSPEVIEDALHIRGDATGQRLRVISRGVLLSVEPLRDPGFVDKASRCLFDLIFIGLCLLIYFRFYRDRR